MPAIADLAEPHIQIKDIGNDPQHHIGQPIKADEQENEHGGFSAITQEKIPHRRDIGLSNHFLVGKTGYRRHPGDTGGNANCQDEPQHFDKKGSKCSLSRPGTAETVYWQNPGRRKKKSGQKPPWSEQKRARKRRYSSVRIAVPVGRGGFRLADTEGGQSRRSPLPLPWPYRWFARPHSCSRLPRRPDSRRERGSPRRPPASPSGNRRYTSRQAGPAGSLRPFRSGRHR